MNYGELPEHAVARYEHAARKIGRDEKQGVYDEARLIVAACELGTVLDVVAGAISLARKRGYKSGHARATDEASERNASGYRVAASEFRKKAAEMDALAGVKR